MKKHKNYALGFILLAVSLLISAVIFWQNLPYQMFAAQKIKTLFAEKNIIITSLTVEKISGEGANLSNIEIEAPVKATIAKLNIGYNLTQIITSGITSGFKLAPNTQIKSSASDVEIKMADITANIDEINMIAGNNILGNNISENSFAGSNKSTLQGEVTIPNILISGAPYQLEPLEMKINFSANNDSNTSANENNNNISVQINLHDKNNLTKSDIELSLPANNPSAGNMKIKNMQIPWGGGVISTSKLDIPLNFAQPIKAVIKLKDVDLSQTLGKVSEEKIKGTGRLNGKIPITYNPDGTIIVESGELKSSGDGIISVSNSLLPGDNAQLVLARTILENFHYTKLKIIVSSHGDKSELALSLQGKNPDASGERPINLNVNLSGDILPLIQNGIMPFDDIKKLSQKEKK